LNRRTVELISEQFPELVEGIGKLELKVEELKKLVMELIKTPKP
jgi:nucleoside-triphosphatase THEP1